jgi:hypothetical protein
MLQDILPYDQDKFKNEFTKTPVYDRIQNDFDELTWDYHFNWYNPAYTPRRQWGDKNLQKTRFSMVIFYYLNFLTEKNPKHIYDLGCGWNIFKKYIPSIIGIGAEPIDGEDFFGDSHDYFDDDFIKGHQNYFESVFSINAIHFVPMSNIRKRILDFASIVKPSGRGFVTFNAMALMCADTEINVPRQELELWIRQQLSDLPFTVLQFDMDLTQINNIMDGNIRLIFEK